MKIFLICFHTCSAYLLWYACGWKGESVTGNSEGSGQESTILSSVQGRAHHLSVASKPENGLKQMNMVWHHTVLWGWKTSNETTNWAAQLQLINHCEY